MHENLKSEEVDEFPFFGYNPRGEGKEGKRNATVNRELCIDDASMHWPNHGESITQPAGESTPEDANEADGRHDGGDLLLGQPCGFEEETSELQRGPWQASETTLDHQDEESGCVAQELRERLEFRDDYVLAGNTNIFHSHWRRIDAEVDHWCKGHDHN